MFDFDPCDFDGHDRNGMTDARTRAPAGRPRQRTGARTSDARHIAIGHVDLPRGPPGAGPPRAGTPSLQTRFCGSPRPRQDCARSARADPHTTTHVVDIR